MGEGYLLCAVILYQGWLQMQAQLLNQVTVMWAGETLVTAACPNFCLQGGAKGLSMLQLLTGAVQLLP